jgi:hypothetical protein
MKNSYSHIILYAKNHYVKRDTIEDLKIIISHRCDVPSGQLGLQAVLDNLIKVTYKYIPKNEHHFTKFIERLNPAYDTMRNDESTEIRTIRACLNVLARIQVNDGDLVLVELDEPSRDILPLTRDVKN